MLACDGLLLRFDGIDTLADVYVNDRLIGCAYNMHRIWEYDLLDEEVKTGENTLKVHLHSPVKYIKEENAKGIIKSEIDKYGTIEKTPIFNSILNKYQM